jgi:MFS family permease
MSPVVVMAAANVARAVLMCSLTLLVLTDTTRIWHVYLLAGGLSALDALYYPASMTAVPTVVGRERLEAANALVQGAEQISGVLGPALAGVVLALYGVWINLGANTILFLVSAMVLAAAPRAVHPSVRATVAADAAEGTDARVSGTLSSVVQGARYAWRDPVIRMIMLILVGINFAMAGPIYVGGSVLAETRLGGASAFGTLVAVGSVGAMAGAAAAGTFGRVRRRGAVELVSTAAMGVGVAALAFVSSLLMAGSLVVLIGMIASFMAVMNISWLQERSEPGVTGRVMSLAMFSAVALDPISYVLAGVLVELDLGAVFLASGGLLLFTALLGATSRSMRTAD